MNLFKSEHGRESGSVRPLGLIAIAILIAILLLVGYLIISSISKTKADVVLQKIGTSNHLCVVLGDPELKLALELADKSPMVVYVQLPEAEAVDKARRIALRMNEYGEQIYVEQGDLTHLHLADNIADAVVVADDKTKISEAEALRVLRPAGKALLGQKEIVKPFPEGVDDWTHPYYRPDNNTQSKDTVIKAPYLTQFLAEPRYAPIPQVAVASAGRVFKAFGHIAFKTREEPYLNKLVAFNGYNGGIIWQRDLPDGMMVHRNTFIATPTTLYVGDHESCKLIDTMTGELKDEIIPPTEVAGGTFWKWMALENGVLYALVGEQEHQDETTKHDRRAHGWPWNKVSVGYNMPKNPWGYGRTVFAIDPKTKEVLWSYREDDPIDSRAVCMKNKRIYIFQHHSFLACLNADSGSVVWRKTEADDPELFALLGDRLEGQGWQNNWRTAAFLKCSDEILYFAGTAVGNLAAVSVKDGSVVWSYPFGRFQLVLRDDAVYATGPQRMTDIGKKFDPLTGEILLDASMGRRACTRPNATTDAIFYRAGGGTVRYDLATETEQWISPMRPNCHDGVTIANGLLYWWPSVCDCQNTLYGATCLGSAGNFDFSAQASDSERLESVSSSDKVADLSESPDDWPTFRRDNTCNVTTEAVISESSDQIWGSEIRGSHKFTPTAPVAAGGMVFYGGSDGIVRAHDAATGDVKWTAYTGGKVYYPPTIWKGRALVGSGDGWIYAFEAKTGRLIWRFRAAPAERKIPVYGLLMSTWPVASGVMVEDGIAYAAAGMLNYDGTHVYALDAATGKLKWQNNTSGHLIPEARTGVSVQGHLLINNGRLYMPGGTSISPAVYDAGTGSVLNPENEIERLRSCVSVSPRGCELYKIGDGVEVSGKPMYAHPKYPVYDRTVTDKLLLTSTGDRDIAWVGNKKILCFARKDGQELSESIRKERYGERGIVPWERLKALSNPLWEYDCPGSVAMAVSKNAVIIAGKFPTTMPGNEMLKTDKSMVVALNLQDGKVLWSKPLWGYGSGAVKAQADAVDYGLAVDRDGRVMVTLDNGRIVCFGESN